MARRPDPFGAAADMLDGDEARWRPLPHQVPPDLDSGDYDFFVLAGGRGTGKTDAGAHAFDLYMQAHPGARGRIIAPTLGDAREACVVGPSGIQAHNAEVHWNSNEGALYWPNGSRAKIFGAHHPEDVERLRAGGNSALDWYEELAAWAKLDEAWNQARFGLRLGSRPRTIVTTTPKTRPRFLWLIGQPQDGMPECPKIVLRHGTTADNPHLSEHVRRELYATYEGTRLGDQELRGLVIADLAGALWKRALLDDLRVRQANLPEFVRIVVGVDPSGGVAETGIVVVGLGTDHHGYVLDDCSVGGSPNAWGVAVVDAYDKYQCDRIVAEVNQGGAMVASTIGTSRPNLPIRTVRAAKGKIARAEPVSALYDQARVHHAGTFPRLEDQMTSWEAASGQESPDRLDACFIAGTQILTDSGPVSIESVEVDDLVWTRAGWRRVEWSGMTDPAADVIRVCTTTGEFTATPNQRMWVAGRGWVTVDALVSGDRLEACNALSERRSSTGVSGSSDTPWPPPDRPVSTTPPGTIAGIAWLDSSNSMSRFGETPTADSLFPLVALSTIATSTRSITTPRIWRRSLTASTPNCMKGRQTGIRLSGWSIWPGFVPWRPSGMGARRAWSGIASTAGDHGLAGSRRSADARLAAPPSKGGSANVAGSAHGPACDERPTVRTATSGRSLVRPAEHRFGNASTGPGPRLALANVLGCYAVRGRQPVYDLTVAGQHEFYANGYLAHNCVWAITDLMLGEAEWAPQGLVVAGGGRNYG